MAERFPPLRYTGTGLHPSHRAFLAALESEFAATRGGTKVRWIDPLAGDADADGSANRPFTPTSAARARLYGEIAADEDCWQQALNSVPRPSDTASEDAPTTLVVGGGTYPAQALRFVDRSDAVEVVLLGRCRLPFGSSLLYRPAALQYGGASQPAFSVTGMAGQPNTGLILFGGVSVGDAGAGVDLQLLLQDFACLAVAADGGGLVGDVIAHLKRVVTFTTFALPTGLVYSCEGCEFAAAMAVAELVHATRSRWANNLTVGAAPAAAQLRGIYDSTIVGTFTGPAGSAIFDQFTAQNCGALAGGAGPGDYLEV